MKIAHIVSTYPPYYGGMGNVVFEMASRLADRGHTVEVFTPEYKRDDATPDEQGAFDEREDYARRLPAPVAYGNAAYLPELQRELDSFDLVHLHYPFFGTAGLVRRWKKRNPTKPLVITYHMDTRGTGLKGLFFSCYAQWFMPSILKSADLLIASSFDYLTASDARDVYTQTKQKWIELPFGVDITRFVPREKPGSLFKRYTLNPEFPTVVFVGGMDSAHFFKGIPVLLEALVRTKNSGFEIQGVFVGEGNLRENFELRARGMGLTSLVRFTGSVSFEELPYHYAMGDVCVLPSTTKGEAFGMVLLESLASGIPVIASDLPGVRTIALEGGEVCIPGSSTDLSELLINFFSTPEKWDSESLAARTLAERKYAWDSIIKRLENEYEKLLVQS